MVESAESALRPSPGAAAKLASVVAQRIVNDVVQEERGAGEVLGSEAELMARYGVSRAVFREAVRLVENQQVARMRRGPGGGLVVTELTVDPIIYAAVLYLHRVGARLDEVFEARLVVEEIVTELAVRRLDETDVEALRDCVEREARGELVDHRAIHRALATMTRNPALVLFVEILNRVPLLYFTDVRAFARVTLDESHRAHEKITQAVIAGDAGLARHRMRTHLQAEAEFLRNRRSSRQSMPDSAPLRLTVENKRAEEIARAIIQDISSARRAPGSLLGSESELIDRYQVSRAVFREAVRLLEHHHVAVMRRGPGGGMFVTSPSVDAVTDIVAVYLSRNLDVSDLAELRTALELALIELAAKRMDAQGIRRLGDTLAQERLGAVLAETDPGQGFHGTIAALCGNRALELVALVLIRLTQLRQLRSLPESAREVVADGVIRTHEAIAQALAEGDGELARHRLRRHLEMVGEHLR